MVPMNGKNQKKSRTMSCKQRREKLLLLIIVYTMVQKHRTETVQSLKCRACIVQLGQTISVG